MKNPRRPNDSPIKVEEGKTTDMRRCKAYKNTADYTYAQTEDYKQREALVACEQALGLLDEKDDTPFEIDQSLLDALNKDKRNRNIAN